MEQHPYSFPNLYQSYESTQKAKIGKPYPYGIDETTFKSYSGRKKVIEAYFTENQINDITQFKSKQCEGFHYWLLNEKNYSPAYAAKTIKLLKSVIKHSVDNHLLNQNPIQSFVVHQKSRSIVYLTERELESISTYNFSSKRIQTVADLFIFQSYTGLSYCDLMNFNRDYLSEHESGAYFIKYERAKIEGSRALIPLMRPALYILKKYGWNLPKISNAKYNSYLKEIADIVDIDKRLTTHVARKTCGTMMLNKGYTIEAVSRMLGHSNIRTTQSEYAEVLEERILLESNGKMKLIVSNGHQLSMAI